jgi:hypothetical protein
MPTLLGDMHMLFLPKYLVGTGLKLSAVKYNKHCPERTPIFGKKEHFSLIITITGILYISIYRYTSD